MTRGLLGSLQFTPPPACVLCCCWARGVPRFLSQRASCSLCDSRDRRGGYRRPRRWPRRPAAFSSSRSGDAGAPRAVWANSRRARRWWKQYRSCAIRGSKPFHEGERPWEGSSPCRFVVGQAQIRQRSAFKTTPRVDERLQEGTRCFKETRPLLRSTFFLFPVFRGSGPFLRTVRADRPQQASLAAAPSVRVCDRCCAACERCCYALGIPTDGKRKAARWPRGGDVGGRSWGTASAETRLLAADAVYGQIGRAHV